MQRGAIRKDEKPKHETQENEKEGKIKVPTGKKGVALDEEHDETGAKNKKRQKTYFAEFQFFPEGFRIVPEIINGKRTAR